MAPAKGHMHVLDVIEALRGHGWGIDDADGGGGSGNGEEGGGERRRELVLFHISGRHRPASVALDLLADAIPVCLADKTGVAVASLLSDKEKGGQTREEERAFLADIVGGDGCVNLGEYIRWREEMIREERRVEDVK
uniref:Uncharacterized protein n=3 Tax=Odontella aurita TaxID=265563 RepID=A0A7S4KCF1_9STRA|mmetsp:Transcript_9148/g.27485  ORF Transcript_9148/g.27485 Transcript_9148/m.27485 type:complete len:137 (+) Transcript_9148:1460-1870(+)